MISRALSDNKTKPTTSLSLFNVKETGSKASETLTWGDYEITILADQALAGLMKPNLVSALIQRGALR